MLLSDSVADAPLKQLHLVDSHCHLDQLDLTPYDGDIDAAINAAREAGVGRILAMSTQPSDVAELTALSRRHSIVEVALGAHPLHVIEQAPQFEEMLELVERYEPAAIGEIGLDFMDDAPVVPKAVQLERFTTMLKLSSETELPVSVHTRSARKETLELIARYSRPEVGGVLHCFTDELSFAREAVGLGFYISMSGIVTFKSAANVRELAKAIPLDRLLIETDSPWLAPVPYRGKPNEPKHVGRVADTIAEVRGISVEEVIMQTSANFYRLFSRIR
ncbi:TatD family hydrolase [Carnimonas nigrificans]|uniref:TatD family hydrolase n=1 Tax=Carnimonas nigrificans TaxID=64323 RepID=UPI0004B460CA|nr:TatD family hydrolase [Carnimonas nigrificans]